jgi:murein DD-endopeptidase MepM/ murein hydrolase activator NlpD
MQTNPSRRRTAAAALRCVVLCLALGCAHGESAGGADTPEPGPVEQAGTPPDATDPSTCADENGNGPELTLLWPARGRVTSRFGPRRGRPHRGIDIAGYYGAAVRAAAAGRVVSIERTRSYGRVLTLEHAGGYETVYAHNQDIYVTQGAGVEQGQVIADVGASGNASGPHLHFEVRIAKRAVDPLACLPARAAK